MEVCIAGSRFWRGYRIGGVTVTVTVTASHSNPSIFGMTTAVCITIFCLQRKDSGQGESGTSALFVSGIRHLTEMLVPASKPFISRGGYM